MFWRHVSRLYRVFKAVTVIHSMVPSHLELEELERCLDIVWSLWRRHHCASDACFRDQPAGRQLDNDAAAAAAADDDDKLTDTSVTSMVDQIGERKRYIYNQQPQTHIIAIRYANIHLNAIPTNAIVF